MKNLAIRFGGIMLLLCGSPALAEKHPHGLDFVHKAVEGDNSEITLGRLAAAKGASDGVRAFGRMLATDHAKGHAEAVQLARQLRTFAPTSMTPEALAEQQKLQRLSGRGFDREFASYMVKDHKSDIADFEAELASNDPAAMKAFAKKTLPVLRKHLAAAQRLSAES